MAKMENPDLMKEGAQSGKDLREAGMLSGNKQKNEAAYNIIYVEAETGSFCPQKQLYLLTRDIALYHFPVHGEQGVFSPVYMRRHRPGMLCPAGNPYKEGGTSNF